MIYPNFFDSLETITIHDPLAQTLGVGDGIFEYSYLDAVKLAGHSCPTVAGAWLCVQTALKKLYDKEIPTRGMIEVAFSNSEDEGVTGVIASIFTLITGASGAGGFKGLQGNFSRNSKLIFDKEIKSEIKITRLDSLKSVELSYDPSSIAVKPQQQKLMKKLLAKEASKEEIKEFGELWQERVKEVLNRGQELITINS